LNSSREPSSKPGHHLQGTGVNQNIVGAV
jgi:hypothetical protein